MTAKANILVVEDSRTQAKILERRLMQAGYAVQVANDGAAGFDLARSNPPDLIISDIEMPRMNGYQLCRAVKNDQNLKSIPVILLSTLSDAHDIIKGLDAGADNYITKPYDPNYLLNRVESLRQTPLGSAAEGEDLSVTIAGQTYRVKSGRQQVLNLLISTFENAVEKNRELHRVNEQLALAKEKLTQWNTTLEALNLELQSANQRMSRDLHAAARVQRSLLPNEDAELPGVHVAWKYTPCEELAGDFLNYFPLDDKHVGLFVVDVSGHGAASSLLAVAIGRLLSPHVSSASILVQRDPATAQVQVAAPSAVARELNKLFPMDAQSGLYFTMVYAVLNTETLELRYVSAGHVPIVHQPLGGSPQLLAGNGFPIGIVDETDFDEQMVQLRPGDRIWCYSDGVPEAMSEPLEQFSEGRMLEAIEKRKDQSLGEAVEGLFESVRAWCLPKGPKDDVSILACEMRGAQVGTIGLNS